MVLPNSLISIEESAFSHCKSITTITIPENVLEVGEDAFNRCDTLLHIHVLSPNKINKSAFGYWNYKYKFLRTRYITTCQHITLSSITTSMTVNTRD